MNDYIKFIEKEIKEIENKLQEFDKQEKLTSEEWKFRLQLLGAYFELCTIKGEFKKEGKNEK